MTGSGAIVPDGTYNVEFKLYNVATSGTALWTETRTGADKVTVANGYLTVSLGSVTSFPGTINWDQDLYLSLNIGGTGTPSWDGEMSPRLHLTAVPYAFRAGQLATLQGGNTSTLSFASQTGAHSILLPDEGGTICLQNSTGCGFLTSSTANGSYIQLQGSSPGTAQTGNFNISGTGIAGILQAATIDTPSGTTTLNIGTTNATGGINLNQNTLVTASDTTQTAFRVQNASGVPMFTIDNLNSRVVIGKSATGSQSVGLSFANSSNSNKVTLLADTNTSASYQLQLPVALGSDGNCLTQTATSGSTASLVFSSCASAGTYIQNTTTAQSANMYVQAATSGSVAGVFRANAAGSGNILNLLNGGGTAVATFGSTGSVLIKPSTNSTTAFRIQNSLGLNDVFDVDTSNARVGINMNNPGYTLDVNGDANVGLFSNYRVGGTIICNASGCTPNSGSSNYIQNQNSADQSANFRISGTGRANTSLQTPLLDTASAAALNIGTTNASSINLNKGTTVTGGLTQSGGSISLTGNATSSISTTSGTLTLQSTSSSNNIVINSGSMSLNSTGTITVGSSNSDTINIGALTNNARTVNVGVGSGGSQTQTVTVGSNGGSSVTTIQGGTGASALNLTTGTNGSINLTTAGTGNINFTTNSASSQFVFKSGTNSTTAFQVKPSTGTSVLNVDTSNSRVGIGTESPTRTLDVAVNDTQTTAPMALLEQAGTGDVSLELKSAAKSFIVGLDSSDSSTFKISSNTASGTSSSFGYATIGGSTDSGEKDTMSCSKYTSGAAAGTVTSVSVHVGNVGSAPNNQYQVAVYADNGGSPSSPGTRLGNSSSGTLTANSWNTIGVSASIAASTSYWLCYYTNASSNSLNNMHYDTGVTNQATWSAWSGSWPSTYSADGHWDAKFSIYATYTTDGAYDSFNGSLFSLTDTGQATFKTFTDSASAFSIQNSSGSSILTVDTLNSQVIIGSATNNITFASDGSFTLNGSARRTRTITVSPEYAGATMTGDGSSNSGTMTSDNMTSSPFRNYYRWTTTQGSAQDYDIWVKVPLPSDYVAMPSGQTICLDVYASATTANTVKLTLYGTNNSSVSLTDGDLTPSSTATWQNQCTSSITGGSYSADGVMTLDFKLTAPASTGDVRIGNISFSYLSKW